MNGAGLERADQRSAFVVGEQGGHLVEPARGVLPVARRGSNPRATPGPIAIEAHHGEFAHEFGGHRGQGHWKVPALGLGDEEDPRVTSGKVSAAASGLLDGLDMLSECLGDHAPAVRAPAETIADDAQGLAFAGSLVGASCNVRADLVENNRGLGPRVTDALIECGLAHAGAGQ